MKTEKYARYEALNPFFEVVAKGLKGLVDGDHYFDGIADNAVFEFLYEFPGWPRQTIGKDALMNLYAGYGSSIKLFSGDNLKVYICDDKRNVVLEYQVHGKILSNGADYNNRFVSIATIENKKIIHWRDYMDSLAAWTAFS